MSLRIFKNNRIEARGTIGSFFVRSDGGNVGTIPGRQMKCNERDGKKSVKHFH
jgi:hypothetical protein